jgi:hypothetical protein
MSLMAVTLINAVALYHVGNLVGESPVRWLAYAVAAYQGLSSVQWLIGLPIGMSYLKLVLDESTRGTAIRQAEGR